MTEERTPRDIEERDNYTRPSGSGQVLWVKVMELIHLECFGKVGSL